MRGAVHVVKCEVFHTCPAKNIAHGPCHEPAGRVSAHDRPQAGAAIRGDDRHFLDVGERRPNMAIDQFERHARQENPVEKSLQDRRVAEVPNRENEPQRVRRMQSVHIGLHRRLIGVLVVITAALFCC